ncbi:hypothetical protein ACQ4PT_051758 [Festuca glaucescens]
MANFPVDPHHFLPPGFEVLEPWGADERPTRMYVTATVAPPKRHESWAIAQVVPRPEGDEINHVLNQVHDHIVVTLQWQVMASAESAVGLGLFRMQDSAIRDFLVAQPAHHLGNGRMLTFVRHDEGENFRATVYTRLSWIMLLNLPMDYRTEEFLSDSFANFGKMRGWIREDLESARTLVICAYGGTRDIPRSIVIREPQRYGGTVVSWTVHVYILSSEPADLLPGDESPEPDNGNPHPQFFIRPIPPHDNWVSPVDTVNPDWAWNNENVGQNIDVSDEEEDVVIPVHDDDVAPYMNPLAIVPYMPPVIPLLNVQAVSPTPLYSAAPTLGMPVEFMTNNSVVKEHVTTRKLNFDEDLPSTSTAKLRAGAELDIPASELTKEKLMANPDEHIAPDVSND